MPGATNKNPLVKRWLCGWRTALIVIQAMINAGKTLEEISAAQPTADFDAAHGPESASLGFVNRVYTDLSKQIAHDH